MGGEKTFMRLKLRLALLYNIGFRRSIKIKLGVVSIKAKLEPISKRKEKTREETLVL